jgi:lipopolysaccharide transport system ATP-binding protein
LPTACKGPLGVDPDMRMAPGDVAIRAEGLGKQYVIGSAQHRHDSLQDVIAAAATRPSGGGARRQSETVWALRDASFEVRRGEVVTFIGRNGAGKSSLLKILSRISDPTKGYAKVHGRVGALLEVGAGFHQELTVRKNVYLSSAILGMKKAEIDRKFDDIASFAEVERPIDRPVKHYSGGMYVRLGFAVATHPEPETLAGIDASLYGMDRRVLLGRLGDAGIQTRPPWQTVVPLTGTREMLGLSSKSC